MSDEKKPYKIVMSEQVKQFLKDADPETAKLLEEAFQKIAKNPENPDLGPEAEVMAVELPPERLN